MKAARQLDATLDAMESQVRDLRAHVTSLKMIVGGACTGGPGDRERVIEAATEKLSAMGWAVQESAGRRLFDLTCFQNDQAGDPFEGVPVVSNKAKGRTFRHEQWRKRAGWLGVVAEPNVTGFGRDELRAIAADRGGRVLFVAWADEAVRFEE